MSCGASSITVLLLLLGVQIMTTVKQFIEDVVILTLCYIMWLCWTCSSVCVCVCVCVCRITEWLSSWRYKG